MSAKDNVNENESIVVNACCCCNDALYCQSDCFGSSKRACPCRSLRFRRDPGVRDAPTEAVRGHLARSARGLPEGLERD
jgi:hypothetical protein